MIFEEGTSKLYFKILDQKLFLRNNKKRAKDGENFVKKHITLEFDDVTAADLKVTSKFGSWDTMATRLLVENRTPLMSWRMVRKKIPSIECSWYIDRVQGVIILTMLTLR